MPPLRDGESIEVAGSTARYTLERKGEVLSCTCPAWRNQRVPIEHRTCKHLRAYVGEAEERRRTGSAPSARVAPRPPVERAVAANDVAAALSAAVRTRDPATIAQAVAHVDLAWRDEAGHSALHLLCRWGCVDGVRALLERGADGRLVDRDGETPYEAIKHAWVDHRREADALYALLRARGLAPAPTPVVTATDAWAEGTRVSHAQFGDGLVKVAIGHGADAKLTIQFPAGMKTLLARFVKRG